MKHADDNTTRYVTGFLIGAAVGVGLALLIAPRPGRELRGLIAQRARVWGERTRRLVRRGGPALKRG